MIAKLNWTLLIFIIALGVVLFLFFGRGCHCGKGGKLAIDTISHTIDTVWIESRKDTHYVPQPYAVYYSKEKVIHDTLETIETIQTKIDTARILAQYFAVRNYSDTQVLKYGSFIIDDTVTQNRITGRGIRSSFNIPEIHETTVIARRRTVGYLGATFMGNQVTPIYSIGATFGLKLKNDKYYGIGAHVVRGGLVYYSAEFKIPIRLRK